MVLNEYDAGLLNDFGGGNVEWWQDYMRAELARAYEHYQLQIQTQGGWQPIETAPRDGALVIVWPPTYTGTTTVASFESDKSSKNPKPYWIREDALRTSQSRSNPPTHWQPVLQGPCA